MPYYLTIISTKSSIQSRLFFKTVKNFVFHNFSHALQSNGLNEAKENSIFKHQVTFIHCVYLNAIKLNFLEIFC